MVGNERDYFSDDMSDLNFTAVISEVNLVGFNFKEWWLDTGVICHVCFNRSMFIIFVSVINGEKLFMGNSVISEVFGKGKVILKMISGREFILINVLYVSEIRKNLVSGFFLSKNGFRMVIEADKLVIIKIGVYVGKGYMTDGLFKLNVIAVILTVMNNEKIFSVYLFEFFNLWHGRLGYVNYNVLRRLSKLNYLFRF